MPLRNKVALLDRHDVFSLNPPSANASDALSFPSNEGLLDLSIDQACQVAVFRVFVPHQKSLP